MRFQGFSLCYSLFFFLFILFPLNSEDFNQGYALFEKGVSSYNNGDFELAIDQFNQAEDIFSTLSGNLNLTAYTSLWRGLANYYLLNYDIAKVDFLLAIDEAIKKNYHDIIVSAYTYLAHSFYSIDNWSEAYDYYQKAFLHARRYKQLVYLPGIYEGLGNIELGWGRYDTALQNYNLSLEYAEQQQAEENIVKILISIGGVHHARNDFNAAIEQYEELLLRANISLSPFYCTLLNSIGMAYFGLGNNDQALVYYQQAMDIAIQQDNIIEIIRINIHMGGVYFRQNKFKKALAAYEEALPLTEEYHRIADRSVCLFNIAQAQLYLGEHLLAIPFFEQSIALKEQLRLSASGRNRLDYLAAEVHVYQWLAITYLDIEEYESAINILEFSSARYLKEQLLGQSQQELPFSGIDAVQKDLESNELIIEYGSSSTPWLSLLTISDTGFSGVFLHPDEITDQIPEHFLLEYTQLKEANRGLAVMGIETELLNSFEMSFDDLITYYRLLLISGSNEQQIQLLGRLLFDFLLAPITDQLEDVNSLTIIPEGILAFLPFETLIMPDGRYVIEKYDISYVQSLAVSEIVANRNYDPGREDFIGFGGANYNYFSPENYSNEYRALIDSNWSNLPGTILELENISVLFSSPDVYLGVAVSETAIKQLSNEGELRNYKIIHFATHGLVLPEQPELSALVVTDTESEDGYLTTKEIAELNIAADFVNLSACETGLGKIYGGEGIVGLAQSFLVAGANSLSVSLWQVSDISTKDFMSGFYELVVNNDYSYKQAMSQMKRSFIQSLDYSHPFFWAPFIFYGE